MIFGRNGNSMIYTVTLNPSVDYFVNLNTFKTGTINRVSQQKKMPGGKGINVSRVLKRLGIESRVLGFVGGFTGDFVKIALNKEAIQTDFIEVPGETRINVKIKADQETELNGEGPEIPQDYTNRLFNQLSQMTAGDWLVLSGSVPNTLPKTIYKELSEVATGLGANLVVDTTGDYLKQTLEFKPFFVKPNQHELAAYFNETCDSLDKIVELGNRLLKEGPQNVLISMGGDGALLVNETQTLFASAPKGKVQNSVGAGDSLVAGFLGAYFQNNKVSEAFRYGVAAGSATAFSLDLCTHEKIESLLPEIQIQKL